MKKTILISVIAILIAVPAFIILNVGGLRGAVSQTIDRMTALGREVAVRGEEKSKVEARIRASLAPGDEYRWDEDAWVVTARVQHFLNWNDHTVYLAVEFKNGGVVSHRVWDSAKFF